MNKTSELAYAEVDTILELLEEDYANRVPDKVKEFFKEEKDKEYKPEIDPNISLLKQNLQRETIVLLAILRLNYWCDSEEEKEAFKKELEDNQKEYDEKYSADNIFKNKHICDENIDNINNKQNFSLVEYKKQGIFKTILERITRFFKKN